MRKNVSLYILILVPVINFSCFAGDKIENQWAEQQIIIDGDYQDWSAIHKYFMEEQNLSIATTNDSDNLYLMFRINNERMARRIEMMGVTVWLSKDSKKRKEYGICYAGGTGIFDSIRPEKPPDDGMPHEIDERLEKMRTHRRENVPAPGQIFIIQGKEKNEYPEISQQGPSASSSYRDGVYFYEFKLPLPVGVTLKSKVTVGLEFGGMSEKNREAMREEMRGGSDTGEDHEGDMARGAGDRGGMPGRRGGGHGGMRNGDHPSGGMGLEKQEVWFTVILANKSGSGK
jgi:hypothetical protein